MLQNLHQISLRKSLAIGVLFGLFTILAYFRIADYSSNDILLLFKIPFICAVLTGSFSYITLLFLHRCPQCKRLWNYSKLDETPLSIHAKMIAMVEISKIEKVCSSCNYKTVSIHRNITFR